MWVDKVEDNIFKFSFGNKKDQDKIYNGRLWSLIGVHLVLKEWDANRPLKEIFFRFSTFTVQIHGLPPVYIHNKSVLKIGEIIGGVHKETINKRCVVQNSYLHFKVDIDVSKPLQAGYFQERPDSEELWIQFKFERLPNFCFKCGMMDHVTGKCHYKESTLITTENGISAQIFGVWLRIENSSIIMFINTAETRHERENEDGQSRKNSKGKIVSQLQLLESKPDNFCETLRYKLDNLKLMTVADGGDKKACLQKEFLNVLEMCPELGVLYLTLKKEELVDETDF